MKEKNPVLVIIENDDKIDEINKKIEKTGDDTPYILFMDDAQMLSPADMQEMIQVLDLCERHGAVTARNTHRELSKYLERYQVVPYIDTLPVLVRKENFDRFGLLDENQPDIRNALAEFSMRINQYGWNTVRANQVFADCKQEYTIHLSQLNDKYPYIQQIEELYRGQQETAAEHFAELLCQSSDTKPSILFSLYEVPPAFNGTSNYALKLLEAFYELYHDKYNICILAKENTDQFHGLSEKYKNVYNTRNVYQYRFDLGYSVSQVLTAEHLDILNRCCLKFSVCMLDIICLRSHYLLKNDIDRLEYFRDSIRFSDLMLSISKFSLHDIESYFRKDIETYQIKTGYVYLATDKAPDEDTGNKIKLPFQPNDYYIVIGNPYKHKMIEPLIESIRNTEENFIVIGTKVEGFCDKARKIYGYISGWLDGDTLNDMLAASKGIIFPSVYEGYGLTFYDAMVYGKNIIVSDTEVNYELRDYFEDYRQNIYVYRKLEEITEILKNISPNTQIKSKPEKIRNWKDAAKELEGYLHDVLVEEFDINKLENRWQYLKKYHMANNTQSKSEHKEWRKQFFQRCVARFPRIYKIYRRLVVAIDKDHYGSH